MATHSLNLVTMATSKNYIKSVFDTYKEGGNKILILGKLSRTNLVYEAIKSYNQLKLLNLVTMATSEIV